MYENVQYDTCAQRRFKSACASAQTDQNLPWAHFGQPRMPIFFMRITKLSSDCANITKTRQFKYIENFTTKNGKISNKKFDIFRISAQNINCGYSLEPPRRGGSNEYPQFMFLSRNKKSNVYPCKRQFYYINVGFMGDQNYISMFSRRMPRLI